jgi:DNA-binding response OmpR family regulator
MGQKRILVVDDDRTVHTYLRGVLGKAGYHVYGAVDALQGSMMARKENPDLVVLDVALPGGGGPSVLERLRNLPGLSLVPVLVYSGLETGRVEKLMPVGADMAFMAKPGTPDELLRVVQSLLNGA